MPLLQSAVKSAFLCRCFHPAHAVPALPPKNMTSPTGNESEVCRKGHHLAIDVLSVLVFVHGVHPYQGSPRYLSGQTRYSILEEKEVAEHPSAVKGSGKAVEKPGKHNGSFCLFS